MQSIACPMRPNIWAVDRQECIAERHAVAAGRRSAFGRHRRRGGGYQLPRMRKRIAVSNPRPQMPSFGPQRRNMRVSEAEVSMLNAAFLDPANTIVLL
jgi:hypothetical protein